MQLEVGDTAPDFTLPDQDGEKQKLHKYKGKWVFLYFYPRDFTPGCTKEACEIRDNFDQFKKHGVVVLGVSTDSVDSHKKFEQKHRLPFTLLSDKDKKVVRKYGVWVKKSMFGKTYEGVKRTSFLIDPRGKIAKIYKNVKPESHAPQVLNDITYQKT